MTNKLLANFIGISCILYFIVEWLSSPYIFSIILGLLLMIFAFMAIIRLWKTVKIISIFILFTMIAGVIFSLILLTYPSLNNKLILISYYVSELAFLISLFWAVITLYKNYD